MVLLTNLGLTKLCDPVQEISALAKSLTNKIPCTDLGDVRILAIESLALNLSLLTHLLRQVFYSLRIGRKKLTHNDSSLSGIKSCER